jgi:3-methyladenine DNA glycosylase Tag
MARYKLVNGERKKFTKAEENARDAEELAWANGAFDRAISDLRNKRNNLLKETDYLALSDNTMSDEMKKYRKDLKDITNDLTTEEEVKAVEFPTKP